MTPQVDHEFLVGEMGWCVFVTGQRMVRIAEGPRGSTWQVVPKTCNLDPEFHAPLHAGEQVSG